LTLCRSSFFFYRYTIYDLGFRALRCTIYDVRNLCWTDEKAYNPLRQLLFIQYSVLIYRGIWPACSIFEIVIQTKLSSYRNFILFFVKRNFVFLYVLFLQIRFSKRFQLKEKKRRQKETEREEGKERERKRDGGKMFLVRET